MKIVMVTGASSGIGAEFVRQLDQSFNRIDEIWMIARNVAKMEEIAATLQNKTRIIGLDLEKEEQRLVKELARVNGMLKNERFISKAPQAKIDEEKAKLEKYTQMMEQVRERLAGLRK